MEIKEVIVRLLYMTRDVKADEERDIALDVAIAALEKQQPRKAKNTKLASGNLGDNGIIQGECPCCGETVIGNCHGEYCGCCGQKIDWEM